MPDIKYSLRSILSGVVVYSCIANTVFASQDHPSDSALLTLANTYFNQAFFPTHPTIATSFGIHTYDKQIENYSKRGVTEKIKALKAYAEKITAIDPDKLSEAVQGDRELLLNSIHSELLTLEQLKPLEKNPDYYSSGITYSAFVIMERKYAPIDKRLGDLIAREKEMPGIFDAARQNLKNPPKIYTQIAIEQLPGLIGFFQHDLPKAFLQVSDADLQHEFKTANDNVIKSLQAYQAWLEKEILPKKNGDFRIGEANFRKKLMYDEMVDLPLSKLLAINQVNMRQNQKEFNRIAKELYPHKSVEQALSELGANHPAPRHLLDDFHSTFSGLIKFIAEKQIISIPTESQPILEETPPFMRATTFASMDTPGPFEENAKEAYFNVTLPDPAWTQHKTADFMRQFNYPVINNISVHEAYPGHFTQFIWMQKVKDPVRKILGANSNAEGWAHYCEQMMLDEGLGHVSNKPEDRRKEKLLRLGQLENALLRNARFVVGIKMHTGQMTYNQAIDYFVKEGYQSRTGAIIETKRGTTDPTYLYYTLGKLQILKLRHDMQVKEGAAFNLKKFHDDFMLQGYPPIKIVRRAMLHDESPTL